MSNGPRVITQRFMFRYLCTAHMFYFVSSLINPPNQIQQSVVIVLDIKMGYMCEWVVGCCLVWIILKLVVQYLYSCEMQHRHDKLRNGSKRAEDIRYCRGLKEFLETYKTIRCILESEHRFDTCRFYHSPSDKRRNPYSHGTFLYYLNSHCLCDNPKCMSYHSDYEYSYHPLVYKTMLCSGSVCEGAAICWMAHKQELPHFEQGEFFRFDIQTFKTSKCTRTDPHERKTCLGFHNDKDRRRPNFKDYTHIPCNKSNCSCERSHNKIEQLYHPTRYKTKFCQHFNRDPLACEYHDFCSFAHTKDEILIPLIDPDNKDFNYIISIYKTVWCPYTQDHDRAECPYAHNIQDFRRKPSEYKYKPQKCPSWDFSNKIESIELAKCPNGMNCSMCHGWMEHRYHPLIYKSQRNNNKNYPKKEEKREETKREQAKREEVKKEEYIQRKLSNHHKETIPPKKQSNLQAYVNKEMESTKAIFTVGAPFFKPERESEREPSDGSIQTKPKTPNHSNLANNSNLGRNSNQSNIGSEKSFNSDRKASQHRQNKKFITPVLFQHQEHELWQCDSGSNSKSRNSDGRSKSQGTSNQAEGVYSRSIKEFINDNAIIQKLQREKVNEVSLVNMTDKKINEMDILTKEEREQLVRSLKKYNLKVCLKIIDYSLNLTHYFAINNAAKLLQKLQRKFIREHSLLLLSKQAIKEFGFLNQQEKELLPKLLKGYSKFSDAKEFDTLLTEVNNWVKDK